jgi:hypothetical protein
MTDENTTTKRPRINATEFALAWDKAKSPEDVAAKYNTDVSRIKIKAAMMRRRGVKLKKFSREYPGNATDWNAINEQIREARIARGEDPEVPEEPVVAKAPRKPREPKAPTATKPKGKKKK